MSSYVFLHLFLCFWSLLLFLHFLPGIPPGWSLRAPVTILGNMLLLESKHRILSGFLMGFYRVSVINMKNYICWMDSNWLLCTYRKLCLSLMRSLFLFSVIVSCINAFFASESACKNISVQQGWIRSDFFCGFNHLFPTVLHPFSHSFLFLILYESTTGNDLNNPLILSICCALTGLSLIRAGMLEGPWGGLAQRFGTEQGRVLERRSAGEGDGGLYAVEVLGLKVV